LLEDDFRGTVFIHVGPHKTGTTSLQSFLSENHDALIKESLLYPKAGRGQGGHAGISHNIFVKELLTKPTKAMGAFRCSLADELERHRPEKIFLSSEVLAREWLNEDVFKRLQSIFPLAKRVWIAVLRKQDELLLSHYQEGVKRNSIKSPWTGCSRGKFVSTRQIWHLECPEILDHSLRMDKLKSYICEDDLRLLLFDSVKADLCRAILEIAGLAFGDRFQQSARRNEGMPWRVVYAMQITNRLPRPLAKRASRAIRSTGKVAMKVGLGSMLAGVAPLSEAERAFVRRKYAASNRRICEKYFSVDDIRYL